MTLVDLIEIAGSLLILAAFGASQLRKLDAHSVSYLLLNIAGGGILAAVAAADRSWGFLLLEGTWTIVSTISLISVLRSGGGAEKAGAGSGSAR
jgi:hypothetical protein